MTFVAFASLIIASNNVAKADPSYLDVIRTCGAEWRERGDKIENKGVEAWNKFRVECVARKGYVTKNARKNDFARVPDKTSDKAN
jgi:hypothetical protein